MKLILKTLQSIDNLVTYIFSNSSKEDKFLKKFFGNKKIVLFDIGANLGGYLDLVKKNTKIKEAYIFEPSRKCYTYLNKKYNQKKFNFINKALSDKKKKLKFYENEVLSQSSLYNKKNKFNSNLKILDTYKINCTTLDKFYYENNKKFTIDLLKIDAEGEDLKILQGGQKLLKKNKIKLIKIELLNSFDEKKNKSNINEIIFLLDRLNYNIITISKTKFVNEKLLMMDVYFCKKKSFKN